MCMSSPKPPKVSAPPPPPTPVRADEQVKSAVNEQLDVLRRRRGREATQLTGGLGDTSYGSNTQARTLLGQ